MADATQRFILRFSIAYFGFILVTGGLFFWFVPADGPDAEALAWIGATMIMLLCLLGAAMIAMLLFRVRAPLKQLNALLSTTLDGKYDAIPTPQHPSSNFLSETLVLMTDLINRYKNRLGFSESMLKGLPMPCVIVETGEQITFLNRECLDMLGMNVAPETFYGQMISRIFYKDDRKSVIGTCMDEDSRAMNIEAIFKHADGSDINVLANLFPLHDVQGTVIGGCCVYLNTTKLKHHEAEIMRQNECIAKAAQAANNVSAELANATNDLKTLIHSAREGAIEQTARTTETASAIEEMYASVLEIARHAQDAADNADNAKLQAKEGATIVTEVVEAIHQVATHATDLKSSMEDLDTRSESIGKVLSVIEDIADQTNLLALNAAIEAARAGDAGRGFAVVADEVRKLAEKTMQATTEVHAAISGIQEGARANVKATEIAVTSVERSTEMASRSGKALAEILSVSEITAERIRAIASAAQQQSAASDEINQATLEVNRISGETDQAMAQSTEAISRLSTLVDSLSATIQNMQ